MLYQIDLKAEYNTTETTYGSSHSSSLAERLSFTMSFRSLDFLHLKTDSLAWGSIIVNREGKLTEEYVDRNFMSHFCLLLLVRIKSCDHTKVTEISK